MGDYDDGEITYSDNSRVTQRGMMGRSEEDIQDIEAFKTFLRSFSGEGSNSFPYRDKLRQNSKLEKRYLEVDIDDLRSYNDTLASLLISNPASYLPKVMIKKFYVFDDYSVVALFLFLFLSCFIFLLCVCYVYICM